MSPARKPETPEVPSTLRRGSASRRRALREALDRTHRAVDGSRQQFMRRADKPSLISRVQSAAAPPDLFTIDANRMGYGPISGQSAEWIALGSDADSRHDAYVDQQTDPGSIVDTDYDNERASAGFNTLDKTLAELWVDHHVNNGSWSYRIRPVQEVELDTFMRCMWSKKQLQEVMVEFWLNHFSMYGWDFWSVHVWPHVVSTIRYHCFRNFHGLLTAITKHPSMLYYLDNYANTIAGPNENHGRELVELHTMGAENYYGVGNPSNVPLDGNGWPIAYVDNDVYEATRALTGWSVANGSSGRPNNGNFFYDDADHDRFQKVFLGLSMPANRKEEDGEDVLRRLADHPGTARYIARKLCRRFIGDDPPQSIVDAAAAKFLQFNTAPFQLREVVRTILKSSEYKNTWNEKVKRPFEVAVAALRATKANFTFGWNDDDSDDFLHSFDRCGQALFTWPTPDGFPDTRIKWQSTTPRVYTWRHILWMSDERAPSGNYRWNVEAKMPSSVQSANDIVDYWISRILRRSMDPADRSELVSFMAQGFNPTSPLNRNDSDTEARIRSLVALIINSPTFLER